MKYRILGLLAACLMAGHAAALTIGDSRQIGLVDAGEGSPTTRAANINYLITMTPGTGPTTVGGDIFTRTTNVFASLQTAVITGGASGSTTSIDLGTGFQYLYAKYDGPNYGSVVWYVAGLTGIITIPQYPVTNPNQYALSGWNLFNPGGGGSTTGGGGSTTGGQTSNGSQVPEPASSLVLLGLGLLGLGFARRTKKAV